MKHEVKMPELGENTKDIELERWLVAQGGHIEKGELLFEVTTDKATLEVESPFTGTVESIVKPEGSQLDAGDVVAVIRGD